MNDSFVFDISCYCRFRRLLGILWFVSCSCSSSSLFFLYRGSRSLWFETDIIYVMRALTIVILVFVLQELNDEVVTLLRFIIIVRLLLDVRFIRS